MIMSMSAAGTSFSGAFFLLSANSTLARRAFLSSSSLLPRHSCLTFATAPPNPSPSLLDEAATFDLSRASPPSSVNGRERDETLGGLASTASRTTTTIDPRELQHFEDIAQRSADAFGEQQGPFKPLHSFNRVRVPWILAHYGKNFSSPDHFPLRDKQILDVGCGVGILSMALCRLGANVTGLDASGGMIGLAQKAKTTLAPEIRDNINFVARSIEEFTQIEGNIGRFDGVVASEVVEHVPDLHSFVQSCCMLAKPNSPLFFTTINRTIWSHLIAKVLAEDVFGLLSKGLHDYDKFVTPYELRRQLLERNCRVGPELGLFYNPLLNRWSWTTFTEVNYALVAFTSKNVSIF